MAQEQYPPGVLLDANGNPFTTDVSVGGPIQPTQAPPGAYLPAGGYSGTTIIVQPDGGSVELTEHDARARFMRYADVWASQPVIAAVVGKMIRRLSILPRKVYQHAPGDRVVSMPKVGNKPPRTRRAFPTEIDDPSDPVWRLIHKPSPGYGPMALKQWQYLSLLVNGGSLLAKFRGADRTAPPTQLIPLDWRFLQAWSRIGQPIVSWATVQTGQLKWILPSEVMFTAWSTVSGANGAWLCTSPLEQLGVTVRIDEAAQRYAAAYFKNAAKPSVTLTLPREVDVRQVPEITARVQKQLEESYGGVDQAFKALVIGGGATIAPWGGSASEAQMVETREQDFREACSVYDMPFNAMFPTGTATPEDEAQVWKALQPTAFLADEAFNAQVIDTEPEWADALYFVRTDFNEALYGDPLVLSDKMVAEVGGGLRSTNEGRIPLGLEPRDDPRADELIYHGPSAGLVGDMPGSFSAAVEEREMVMPAPGTEEPLEEVSTKLGSQE